MVLRSKLLSMTGFSSKTITLPTDADGAVSLTVTIKSLNSRFFESTFKMPYALSFLETELIQRCKTQLKRGHIFFTITLSSPDTFKVAAGPSKAVVKSYLDAIQVIKKSFSIGGEITIAELIQLPNIFAMEEKAVDDATKKIILDVTQEVLSALLEARAQEGASLKKDIEQRCAHLSKAIDEIEKISEKIMERRKHDISAQLRSLSVNEDDITETQRLALYHELTRIDIHEEIVRFKTHLQSLQKVLANDDVEKGKRIDFTLQELSRETNTIAAKGTDASLSSLAVSMKVELEKIREQNQNIV